MTVRAPMLLDGSMNEVRRLEPASLSLTLTLTPPSTADMTLTMDRDNPVPMRSWIRLYTIHGDAGIFRVSASDTEYDTEQQRLTLEHGITSLRDTIIPPLTDTDEDSEVKQSAGNTLGWLLERQNSLVWVAGECEAPDEIILDQNGRTLFEMLLDMMDQLPDYDLSFDQSAFPWTVSVVRKADTVTAEGRLSRNLGSVRVTYDDSELCTRVYMPGLPNGYMDADTQGIYGIVEASVYLNTDTEQSEAERIAERYLKKRKKPALSVELSAVDLSSATGETIDAFQIGKKFRLAIPAYGLIEDQWITGIDYSDVYGNPNYVTLTLGNRIADISQRMAKVETSAYDAERSASGAGSGGVRTNASLLAQARNTLSDHDEYIAALEDGTEVFRIDDSSLTVKQAVIKLFTQQRDLYTGDADGIKETLRQAGITVDAGKSLIELFASMATTYDGRIDTAESRLTIDEQHIEAKVSYGEVASRLAIEADNITLESGKIILDGYVTAPQLSAALAHATNISTEMLTVTTDNFSVWKPSANRSAKASWKSTDVVTSVNFTTSTAKKRTIYYLGEDPSSEF